MKHYFNSVLSLALVGDPAILVALETGLVSDKVYGGLPHSRATCLSQNAGGETISIVFPGAIANLSPGEVAQRVATLDFVRVRFTGLICEVKGGEYNRVTYTGAAEKAEVVTTPPASGAKSS